MADIPDDQELSRVRLNERFGTSLLRHAVSCSSQYTLEFRQLAAEILRLRQELDAAKRPAPLTAVDDVLDIYAPGQWTCPKCAFGLTKATLFVGGPDAGTVGHTHDQVMGIEGEVCPNDGDPMRRKTWREVADEDRKWGLALIEEIIAATGAEHLPGAIAAIKERFGSIVKNAAENAVRPPLGTEA